MNGLNIVLLCLVLGWSAFVLLAQETEPTTTVENVERSTESVDRVGQVEITSRSKAPKKVKKKKKVNKVKVPCPDTCTLKRKIGKVEATFKEINMDTKEEFATDIADLKLFLTESIESISTNNQPSDSYTMIYDMQKNLSRKVDEQLNKARILLRTEAIEDQRTIMNSNDQLKELMRTIPAMVTEATVQQQRLSQGSLVRTMAAMNRTFNILRAQNAHLSQQSHGMRQQNMAIRAQNEALETQNRQLRTQTQNLETKSTVAKDKIRELEDKVGYQNNTLYRLDNKLRWLEKRVDTADERIIAAKETAEDANAKAVVANLEANRAINDLNNILRRRPVATEAPPEDTTLAQPDVPPTDCGELMNMGYNISGVYMIQPWMSPEPFEVYCLQSYDGGGWTIFQRRRDGSVDFNRGWLDYTHGFGDIDGEYWLGNEKIYRLTNQDTYTLQVLLQDQEKNRAFAEYEDFVVQSPGDYYSLRFGNFLRGNAGDGLRGTALDGSRNLYRARFSTRESDNDSCRPCLYEGVPFESCARLHKGGWWYKACTDTNLNGRFIEDPTACGDRCWGIEWSTWKADPLNASIMMIRRTDRNK